MDTTTAVLLKPDPTMETTCENMRSFLLSSLVLVLRRHHPDRRARRLGVAVPRRQLVTSPLRQPPRRVRRRLLQEHRIFDGHRDAQFLSFAPVALVHFFLRGRGNAVVVVEAGDVERE